MQQAFQDNCLNSDINSLHWTEYKDTHHHPLFNLPALRLTTDMDLTIQTAFNNCRKFIRAGFWCSISFIMAVYVIYLGLDPFLANFQTVSINFTPVQNSTANSTSGTPPNVAAKVPPTTDSNF
jgi:uncharacterized membrane protein YccF (DUF307 family)